MENNCQNCNHSIVENFCSNCGQKKFRRIDKKYIFEEFQYTILHTNKGLFYTIKKLLKNPGKTAKEYIEGNRVNHYKPLLLIFLLSGVSTFISYKVLGFSDIIEDFNTKKYGNSELLADTMTFMANYNTFIMLLLVPLFAITTKISFNKWGNNYYEHIVMNCYILSTYTLIGMIVVYPIMFFLKNNQDSFIIISQIYFLIVPFILIWFFRGFYSDKPLKSIILKSLAAISITAVGYIVVVICITILFVVYAMTSNNPEMLEYMKPKK